MEFEVLNKSTKVCNWAHFPYRSRASWILRDHFSPVGGADVKSAQEFTHGT